MCPTSPVGIYTTHKGNQGKHKTAPCGSPKVPQSGALAYQKPIIDQDTNFGETLLNSVYVNV
jgi:hypothetical protein